MNEAEVILGSGILARVNAQFEHARKMIDFQRHVQVNGCNESVEPLGLATERSPSNIHRRRARIAVSAKLIP
jgi:hypothetical protein